MTTALELTGVTHAFDNAVVLDDVNLFVTEGKITALLGPSGVGKTTLLRIICGFETPQQGTVNISGRVVARDGTSIVAPEHRGVGLVPQEGALFPHLTVAENVAFGLKRRRSSQARSRVQELLHLVDLESCADRHPAELSGGMQQRVALARALAPNPAIVLLDEPFASLDAALRVVVRTEIVEVIHRSKATALWVTHDQQEALSCADDVAVLLGHQVAQHGTPVDLYRSPNSRAVAEFVGEAVRVKGVARGLDATSVLGDISLVTAQHGNVTLIVRPEQIELEDQPNQTTPRGEVIASRFYGHDGEIDVRLPTGDVVVARLHARLLPAVGSVVALRVNGQALAFA
ncbi:MAG: ABC transporter ATP-binding protein [Actinomycetota bacterium]|nr:ABC transporter ATP-binding protein [Actinomycetota bacterium]